jgi:hypothetical protein
MPKPNNKINSEFHNESHSDYNFDTTGHPGTGDWIYYTYTWNTSDGKLTLYEDGSFHDDMSVSGKLLSTSDNLEIGKLSRYGELNGKLDEIRISKIARDASWVKASYYSHNDNLIDWYAEETKSQVETLSECYKTDQLLKSFNNKKQNNIDTLFSMNNMTINNSINSLLSNKIDLSSAIDILSEELNLSRKEILDLIISNDNKTIKQLVDIVLRYSDIDIGSLIDSLLLDKNLDKDELIDIIITKQLENNLNIDILSKDTNRNINEVVDSLLYREESLNIIINQLIMNGLLERHINMESLISLLNTKKETIDSSLMDTYNMNELIDLIAGEGKDIGIRIDLLIESLKEQKDLNIDIDLLLSKFIEHNLDIDALIKETGNRQHLFDVLSKETNVEANVLFDTYLEDLNNTQTNLIDSMIKNFNIDKSVVIDVVIGLIAERKIDIDLILKSKGLHKSFLINTLIELSQANKHNLIDMVIQKYYNRQIEMDYTTQSTLSRMFGIDFKSGVDTLNVNYLMDANIFNLIWINYARPTQSSMFSCTNNYKAAN